MLAPASVSTLSLLLSIRSVIKFESQHSMDDKMLSFVREEKDYALKKLQDMSNMCQRPGTAYMGRDPEALMKGCRT